ncbi:MAG: hypothetical protein DRJ40_09500 [Thermoprotei archaeon]|nr:MAG: hypothetical protein DRJ40_09500 [Thermoprotei archaeon]
MSEEILKIKGCLVNKEKFVVIEVNSENDLIKLAKKLNVPIIECDKENYTAVVDTRGIIYIHKKGSK